MRVFLAGATGAIGRRLIPRLVAAGHDVTATTRSPGKLDSLRAQGVKPVIMNGLDAASVGEAVARAEPDAIIHQMTALAGISNLRRFDRVFARTNALRTTGTDHLLAAGQASGVRRFIAQSYTGWTNAREGGAVKTEDDPFDPSPPRSQRQTMAAIRYLERSVTESALAGIVLRYGNFYGPVASDPLVVALRKRQLPVVGSGAGVWSWLHVDDAAAATVQALEHGAPGVYNIVDDEPAPVTEWLPHLAEVVGAPRPWPVPSWVGRLLAGEAVVSMMTQMRGSSNARARTALGWVPSWRSWRDGFLRGLGEPGQP